jgi:hypothetical protein
VPARLMPRFERLLSGSTNGRKEHIVHDPLGQFKRLYHVADKVIGQLSRDELAEAAVGKLARKETELL